MTPFAVFTSLATASGKQADHSVSTGFARSLASTVTWRVPAAERRILIHNKRSVFLHFFDGVVPASNLPVTFRWEFLSPSYLSGNGDMPLAGPVTTCTTDTSACLASSRTRFSSAAHAPSIQCGFLRRNIR
ncbi:hypothetical protein KCP75_08780 [Salmonella enterica subsp. enterica]|nr:hypothetical protein KCP75_08780 [Salmonella enterica subsp. enterica]